MPLTSLIEGVTAHQPRVLLNSELARASVLIAITDQKYPEVILTLRSSQMPTHKGEVAFPGGKAEERDADAIATALREAQEEVGLNPDVVRVIGPLDEVVSRFGFLVTPILGIVPEDVELNADSREIEDVFRVPLKFFLDGQPDQIDQFGSFRGPRWYFEGYTIWGLTAMMIAELLNRFYDADLELQFGDMNDLIQK
jgi:8-oxo-dGTP pyrophosphatase MutT (NUDIX family)